MEPSELKAHFDKTAEELKGLLKGQSDEIKKHGESSEKTATAIAKADERMTALDAEMKSREARLVEIEKRMNRPGFGGDDEAKSIGAQFTESEEFKEYAANGGRGNSRAMQIKDITGAAGSAKPLIPEFRNPNVFMNPDRPIFVRQLVNNLPCSGDAVVIMRENVFTNNAGPQYNVAGNPVNQLVAKNKSNITYSSVTVPVRTMAHYIIASRQILSDVPRLRGMIDQRLRYGLDLEIDDQLLYGNGLTENFTGLFTDTAVPDIGGITDSTPTTLAGKMIDHIRHAITQCQVNEYYNVNGLILNPQDWELLETAKGSDGHYIWVTVPNGGEQRMWRVPVVVSNAVQVGDFMLGDWTMGATLYQREGMSVRASESHANLFTENGVAILGEERDAFAIELPKAFTKGSFEPETA